MNQPFAEANFYASPATIGALWETTNEGSSRELGMEVGCKSAAGVGGCVFLKAACIPGDRCGRETLKQILKGAGVRAFSAKPCKDCPKST